MRLPIMLRIPFDVTQFSLHFPTTELSIIKYSNFVGRGQKQGSLPLDV